MTATRYHCLTLGTAQDTLAEDVRRGLTAPQKWLPCKYFYDSSGSALFERICELPEYYLTPAEESILREQAGALLGCVPPSDELIELGSGNARKTRHLLRACLRERPQLIYYPIDIAPGAIEEAAGHLQREFPALQVVGLVGEYADGLDYLALRDGGRRLVVFLGSTVGNFDEEELAQFLTMLRGRLRKRDAFLLGFDLLKDEATLIAAYDDSQGVTARFNLNLLARVNRLLSADFDLSAFRHRAVFDHARSRIEMHLVSARPQTVRVGALGLQIDFAEGETIHTENCYKHSREAMQAILARHGFTMRSLHTDVEGRFCLLLAT
jgi:L-histidine N-alpha-methyltransferase